MSHLLNPVDLMQHPRNTPMFLERLNRREGTSGLSFEVAWRYDESDHTLHLLGNKYVCYDIDDWNVTWRAWHGEGAMPTEEERRAERWRAPGPDPNC